MILSVDPRRCIGCGMCAAGLPEVFRLAGGVSTVAAAPAPGQRYRILDIANGCPVNAIRVQAV